MNIERSITPRRDRMRKKMTKQAYHFEERPIIPLLYFSPPADEGAELSSISVTSIKTAAKKRKWSFKGLVSGMPEIVLNGKELQLRQKVFEFSLWNFFPAFAGKKLKHGFNIRCKDFAGLKHRFSKNVFEFFAKI